MSISNFDKIKNIIEAYIEKYSIQNVSIISNLHNVSKNNADPKNVKYVYDDKQDFDVIDMDIIAEKVYKIAKDMKGDPINTADAFLIKSSNEWFFIEFKDTEIKAKNQSLKNNIIKKAYANWYMLLDILYDMKDLSNEIDFDFNSPIRFAQNNVYYIVVCSSKDNPNVSKQIINNRYFGQNYTPEFMQKLKGYLFKDAYIYTEEEFKIHFVRNFAY